MKKLYTLMTAALISLGAMAQTGAGKEYTEDLVITVNEEVTEVGPTTVVISANENGTYNFTLKNFLLISGEDIMPIGNIALTDVPATTENGVTHLAINQTIVIEPGDLEGSTPDDWFGPLLGEVPLRFTADVTEEHVYAHIDIDMSETIGQIIEVALGSPIEQGENVDAITAIQNSCCTTAQTYTIGGVLTQANKPGLYIVKGKKILVK